MKVHEWLASLDANKLYEDKQLIKDMLGKTGKVGHWPARKYVKGWEVAITLEVEYNGTNNFEKHNETLAKFDTALETLRRADV